MNKVRDWIVAAKAEARANTTRHKARLEEHWRGLFEECPDCVKRESCTIICDAHSSAQIGLPCEGCSRPVFVPDDCEWEHRLCAKCEEDRPADFLEFEKAVVLCEDLIAAKDAMIALLREQLRGNL